MKSTRKIFNLPGCYHGDLNAMVDITGGSSDLAPLVVNPADRPGLVSPGFSPSSGRCCQLLALAHQVQPLPVWELLRRPCGPPHPAREAEELVGVGLVLNSLCRV